MIKIRQIKGLKDLLAGLIFMVIGVAAFFLAHDYDIGTPLNMGPGFFPALVGVLLVGLGLATVVVGLRRDKPDPFPKLSIEPLLLISAGGLSFSFLVDRAGLVVAIAALLFFGCFRRLLSNPIEVLVTYAVLTCFSVAVFIYGFGMAMPVFWRS